MYLRQSTSQIVRFGPFVDSTDGVTAETALTIAQADMQLSKDGGAFAQKNASGNATHDTDGWYSTTLNTTDTATVGELYLQVVVSGALPVWVRWWVMEEAIYDALFGASAAGFNSSGLVTLAAVTHTGATIPTVTTLTGRTAQTGDNYARLGATAGASVSADIATVDGNVDTLVTRVPNTISLANINAEVDTAFTDYDPPTRAELTSDIGGLDTKIDTIDSNVDAILVDTGTTLETHLTDIKGGTFSGATDSLEAIRDRGDAAWTTGAGGSAPTVEAIRAEMDSNSTQLAAIVADTNELQTDDVPGLISALDAKIDTIDTNVDAVLVDTGTTLPASIATVDSNVDAILVDTGTTIPAQITALNDVSVSDILTTQMTESYAADGAAPTLAQALMLIQQMLGDFAISGTTLTVREVDGTTTAATFTLNDASAPTAVTRAS